MSNLSKKSIENVKQINHIIDKSMYSFGANIISILSKYDVVCTGLIHLMRRKSGLPYLLVKNNKLYLNEASATKNSDIFAGVGDWFSYLKKNKRLQKFDMNKSYPKGTLLLRNYNKIDKGHLAVIYKENKKGVLFSSLVHSVGWVNNDSGQKVNVIDACVGKNYFAQYNGTTNTGHYTHICLPENWLLKE